MFLFLINKHVLISKAVGKKVVRDGIANVVRRLIQNNSLTKAYAIAFTLLLSYVALFSVIGNYLSIVLHFSPNEIFNIRAIGIIGISGSFLVRPLTRKYNLSKSVALGISIMIISVIFTIIIATKVIIILSLVCFVAGISITIPCLISLVGQVTGRDSGLAVTGYTFIIFVGASIGSLVENAGEFKFVTTILVSILCIALVTALTIKDIE